MKSFSSNFVKIEKTLKAKKPFFFFDYDGTLTPIVSKPHLARLSPSAQKLLKQLSQKHKSRIAIVSGRSLKSVKFLVGIPSLIYAGNHGCEIKGPGFTYHPRISQKYHTAIKRIKHNLNIQLKQIKGVIVEDKGWTLSVHYRNVPDASLKKLKKLFSQEVNPYTINNSVMLKAGKKVWEIRPPVDWHKGKAVLWILKRMRQKVSGPIVPIYFGDDITDEDAFIALKRRGIGVLVGKRKSSKARYCISGPQALQTLLRRIVQS